MSSLSSNISFSLTGSQSSHIEQQATHFFDQELMVNLDKIIMNSDSASGTLPMDSQKNNSKSLVDNIAQQVHCVSKNSLRLEETLHHNMEKINMILDDPKPAVSKECSKKSQHFDK